VEVLLLVVNAGEYTKLVQMIKIILAVLPVLMQQFKAQ
jgi:hypothetical protein